MINMEEVYYGDNITTEIHNKDFTVYKMKNTTGEGVMTEYEVFPGVYILFNEFNMENCISKFKTQVKILVIDYCREGRIEWKLKNGSYMYMGAGDFQISGKTNHALDFGFPLKHYNGISIAVHIEKASKNISSIVNGITFDLKGLYDKFCFRGTPFIVREKHDIQHIFSELYVVPEQIKQDYFKIKVLELLLFLNSISMEEKIKKPKYYSKEQVKTIKEIMSFMTNNMEKQYTLHQLASKFHISLTYMKSCFKAVYGMSIYAYMRKFRMEAAGVMLKEGKESITVISGKVGYENSSKFAAAFKKVMNMTPSEFRKKASIDISSNTK